VIFHVDYRCFATLRSRDSPEAIGIGRASIVRGSFGARSISCARRGVAFTRLRAGGGPSGDAGVFSRAAYARSNDGRSLGRPDIDTTQTNHRGGAATPYADADARAFGDPADDLARRASPRPSRGHRAPDATSTRHSCKADRNWFPVSYLRDGRTRDGATAVRAAHVHAEHADYDRPSPRKPPNSIGDYVPGATMRHKADDRTDGHPDARSHRDADACSHGDADTRSHGDAVHRRDANARPGAAPLSASGTGINPWWRYQEEDVPGAGHVMVNVGTGNLLIQVDDMSVPHKGMALAFRRTYNSQSLHNVNGADGSPPGLYGNGWTNTFDAHLVQTSIGLSVYDIDGARYDYNCTSGTCVPPPGQHATLTSDGGCGLLWTKKTGTIYYFWNFNLSACGVPTWEITAYGGRLYEIIGRNRNTSLTFYYSWTTAGPGAQPAAIMATTESGLSTTLSFSLVSGYELLTQLTRPDGTTVTYSYDTYGNLTAVGKPAPNSSGGTVYETYGAVPYAGSYVTAWAASPRWAVDNGACSDPHVDCGGYLSFAYVPGATLGTTTLSQIQHVGYVDPTIADGSNSGPIQPLPGNGSGVAAAPFLGEYYTLSALGTARTPTFQDTEGHYTNWVVDASGRPTQTQECTGTQGSPTTGMTCTGLFLTSNEGWDANNNRTAEVDPRGYETDHAYDPNGNSIATASPQLTTAQGTFRPTALYSYDSFNNVVAYCDPVATAQLGGNWTTSAPSPSDALCPQTTLATQFQYTYPTYEPYGELQVTTSPATAAAPNGYHHTFSYATAQQSGADFGLPTSVVGDSFTQADGTTRQPTQVFWYDYKWKRRLL